VVWFEAFIFGLAVIIAALYLLRWRFRSAGNLYDGEPKIGSIVVLSEPILAGRGRLKLGASEWVVMGPDLAAGRRVRIVGGDSECLFVEPARTQLMRRLPRAGSFSD
jgi:membrane protein implicated in regulation of membrane protease activity